MPIHAEIKIVRKEIGTLKADLFVKYGTPEAHFAGTEHKQDALFLSEICGVLQVAVFICEFYDTSYPIFSLPDIKEQNLEDMMTMVFHHYSYLGDIVTFFEPIDAIHDQALREYGNNMIKALIRLIHVIDAVEEKLCL